MNFSVVNNRLKLSNGYDVNGSINTTSLLVGSSNGINPSSTLDVSGTANITGNLSVDTNTLFVDASNNRVGVGLTTPANTLDVRGITRITNDDGNSMLYVNSVNPTGISATILNALVNSGAGYGELQTRGSIQTFYTTTNERMRITNSGDVGVGTTTPETRLDVVGNSIQCSNQGRFKGWYSGGQGSGLATEIGTLSGEGYINTYNRTAGTYGPLNLVAGSSANIKLLTNGNVGIGTNAPAFQLELSTNSAAKPTSNTWTISSDQRVKENIENADLDRCNEIVENLSLKRFQWSEKYFPTIDDRNSIGFIAQEVDQYFPNAVKTHKNKFLLQKGEIEQDNIYEEIEDFKSLDIDQLIKCLFGSVKYLQNQVKTLQQKNETLEQRIANLESKIL